MRFASNAAAFGGAVPSARAVARAAAAVAHSSPRKAGAWWGGNAARVGQWVLLGAMWIYLCSLHWNNDGLWFQGDAPRHALTGLFWNDYLQSWSPNLKEYTLRYFARYPAINPTSYPPLFHLLEGGVYSLLGASPYVAKHLVLLFGLLAAVYTMQWSHRWIAPEAGWAGVLLLLLPGIVRWSHAVMLNIPALGLSLAALYYMRSWLASDGGPGTRRHLLFGIALSVGAVLTYYPAATVLLVIAAWLGFSAQHRLLLSRQVLLWAGAVALAVTPLGWMLLRWAPTSVAWVFPAGEQVLRLENWTYYASRLPSLVGLPMLGMATAGAVVGCIRLRWRRETQLLLIWVAVVYLAFSLMRAREARYVLLLCPPLLMLATIAVLDLVQAVGRRLHAAQPAVRVASVAILLLLIGAQAWQMRRSWVPSLSGFKETAAFFRQHAPAEAVFYDGHYDGVFTFYVRAGDPEFRQRIVLGNKLLYTFALEQGWRLEEYASTPAEVLEILQSRGGCRWLVIETSDQAGVLDAARRLRAVVQGDEFQKVASFPIHARARLDVYRLLVPIQTPEMIDLPFPIIGADARFTVAPIPTRRVADAP